MRGFLPGLVGRVADKLEHLLHVLDVTLANFLRLGIVLGVVVAIGQAEPVLRQPHDHGIGVVGILFGAAAEDRGVAGKMQPRQQRSQLGNLGDTLDLDQLGPDGLGAALLHHGLVHAGSVVVANLLGNGIAILGRGSLLQNRAQIFQVIFV